MTINDNDPRPGRAEGRTNARITGATPRVPRPRLAVIDCSCGHPHHLPHGSLGALAEGCKPLLVGVGR